MADATIHGFNATFYLSPGSGDAIPVGLLTEYNIDLDFDLADASSCGDVWESAKRGHAKYTIGGSLRFNTGAKTLWSAATATAAQTWYLYPDRATTGAYYGGTAFIKLGAVKGSNKSVIGTSFTGQGNGALTTT